MPAPRSRRDAMANDRDAQRAGIDRRDFMVAGAGAALLAVGLGSAGTAHARAGRGAVPPPPGKAAVGRRGAIMLIGIDRPQAQNRLDAPVLIGLGKAYYQFEHDDELRVAVLHGIGADFCAGLDVPAFTAAQAAGILPPKDPDIINPIGARPPFRSNPVVAALQAQTL